MIFPPPGQRCGGRVVVVGMVRSNLQLFDCIHPEVVVLKATTLHTYLSLADLLTASMYQCFDTGLKWTLYAEKRIAPLTLQ